MCAPGMGLPASLLQQVGSMWVGREEVGVDIVSFRDAPTAYEMNGRAAQAKGKWVWLSGGTK